MKKNKLLLAFLAFCCLPSMAQTKQTVTVDGAIVGKNVTQITFTRDNVVLHYADNTTQTASAENVNIDFTYTVSGIQSVTAASPLTTQGKIYTLSGQYVGQEGNNANLPKGVYIVNGKKMVIQ